MNIIVDVSFDNQTKIINESIKKISLNGGGTLYFKDNETYICGSIILRDNVTIYLGKNCRIIGSSNLDDYMFINEIPDFNKEENKRTFDDCSYNGNPSKCFIYAKDTKNIKITGSGIIDGNEEIYYGRVSKYQIEGYFYPRIPVIFLENCTDFEISGITITKSAFWTIHLVGVDKGLIENITIDNNLKMANCDGIDPDHSKNLIIRNCNISAADDCIVFKNTKAFEKYGACENITVSNCNLVSTSAAIKFGTESVSDFRNINISDCNISKSNRGISIQLRDSGNINDCNFSNLKISTRRFEPLMWWGASEPISITAVRRDEDTKLGKIFNLSFSNIVASSETGILVYCENDEISNVIFENINLSLEKKTNYSYKGTDLRPTINNTIEKDYNYALFIKSKNIIKYKELSYTISDNIKNEFDSKAFIYHE